MVKKAIKPLIVALVVTLLVSFILPWAFGGVSGGSESALVLAYEGIGKGLDPKGNILDIRQIKSKAVLKSAIEKAGLSESLSYKELQTRVTIAPVAQAGALGNFLTITSVNGKTEAVTDKISHSGKWVIRVKDTGLPNPMETMKLTNAITQAYCEYLKNQYLGAVKKTAGYTGETLERMDYSEKAQLLGQEADALVRYAKSFGVEAQFASKLDGKTFTDVQAAAELLRDSDVKNVKDIINYYMITQDPAAREIYEQVRLRRAQVSETKAAGSEYAVSSILEIYNNNTNFVYTMDNVGLYAGKPADNPFYGDLTRQLMDRKSQRIEAAYKLAEINKNLETLQTGGLTPEERADFAADMDGIIQQTYLSIEELRTEIQGLASEYYEAEIESKISTTDAGYRPYAAINPIAVFITVFAIMLAWNLFDVRQLMRKGVASLKQLSRKS